MFGEELLNPCVVYVHDGGAREDSVVENTCFAHIVQGLRGSTYVLVLELDSLDGERKLETLRNKTENVLLV